MDGSRKAIFAVWLSSVIILTLATVVAVQICGWFGLLVALQPIGMLVVALVLWLKGRKFNRENKHEQALKGDQL